MIDYDFATLNDKEFEELSIDLVSRDLGKQFSRYKTGRDLGIDGKCNSKYGDEIIQCKHYLKTGYKGLISKLRTDEASKVRALNLYKYIFVTSLPLSCNNKKEIQAIFEPYIKRENDIYGQEDLNDLLKSNKDIEERYYKLWISSTTVLRRVLNNTIIGRSYFLLKQISEKLKFYVVTKNHNNAIKKLNELSSIIITGEPGIGKTTLAENILLEYVINKGYKCYVIENSLSEAESIFNSQEKQIFYFDDFLGSNYLQAVESNSASHIMRFIKRVRDTPSKYFILTSRTHILKQGVLSNDLFQSKKLDHNEFIIAIDSLSNYEKAQILYNHIWHGSLGYDYIDVFYHEKRYHEIIKHKNFNPRIIDYLADINEEDISPNMYWEHIGAILNNPKVIWANTFNIQ